MNKYLYAPIVKYLGADYPIIMSVILVLMIIRVLLPLGILLLLGELLNKNTPEFLDSGVF